MGARLPAKQLQSGTAPSSIGTANSTGSGDDVALANHVHDHGAQPLGAGTQHALATDTVAGFLAPADYSALQTVSNQYKRAVRVATTVNVNLSAGSSPTVVDSVTVTAAGTRILVKDQTTQAENGIYVVVSSGTWVRDTDGDSASDFVTGLLIFVRSGTTYAGTVWSFALASVATLGSSLITFLLVAAQPASATPAAVSAAAGALGSGVKYAKDDHAHQVTAGSPVAVGTANADGVATSLARSDHVHDHGAQTSGTLHAVSTTSVAGFHSAADKTKINALAAGQSATVGYLTVDCVLETPTLLSGTGAVAVDSGIKNDFMIVLGGSTTLNFSAFVAGRQGNIWVKQDATGSRSLAWTVAGSSSPTGFTLVKDTTLVDLNPAQAANALTAYSYAMYTLGGTNYLQISKSLLS